MTQNMVHGKPLNLILKFSIPLLIGNVFQQFYNMADTIIVGQTIGMDALAAVGAAGAICFLIFGFFFGFTSGITVITGQRFGANDYENTRRSIAVSIVLSGAVALLATFVCLALCRPMLVWIKTPPAILDATDQFLRLLLIGTIALGAYNLFSNQLRALGDSRTPLIFLVIACVLNVILDLVFILVFHWGIAGAAVATVISQALSGWRCYIYAKKHFAFFQFNSSDWKFDLHFAWQHLRLALPSAFLVSVTAVGVLIFQVALNRLGVQAVAAYTAASRIDQVLIQPAFSFAIALGTFTAQNYGAGEFRRICKGATICGFLSTGVGYGIALLSVVFCSQLTGLFVPGEEAQLLLPQVRITLVVQGACSGLLTMLLVYRYVLQGMGYAFVPFAAGIVELLLRGFFSEPLCDHWGYTGISFVGPLAWLGSFVLLGAVYYWKIRKLTGRFF